MIVVGSVRRLCMACVFMGRLRIVVGLVRRLCMACVFMGRLRIVVGLVRRLCIMRESSGCPRAGTSQPNNLQMD
jgi:hypothetical protein